MPSTMFDDNQDDQPIATDPLAGEDVTEEVTQPNQPVEQPVQPVQPVEQPVPSDPFEAALRPIANNFKAQNEPAPTNPALAANNYGPVGVSIPEPVRPTRPKLVGKKADDEKAFDEYEKAQEAYDVQRTQWLSETARVSAQQEMAKQATRQSFLDIANISLSSGDIDNASAQALVSQLSTIAEQEPYIGALFASAKAKGTQDVRALTAAFTRDPAAFISNPIETIYNWARSSAIPATTGQAETPFGNFNLGQQGGQNFGNAPYQGPQNQPQPAFPTNPLAGGNNAGALTEQSRKDMLNMLNKASAN